MRSSTYSKRKENGSKRWRTTSENQLSAISIWRMPACCLETGGTPSAQPSIWLVLTADPMRNPPVVCLGRARVDDRWATVSPYSPCCFQELLESLNPALGESCALFCKFL